jgi:hypothetical protein
MENIFNQKREFIINAYPSVFSKDDVLRLLSEIQDHFAEQNTNKVSLERLKENILEIIENCGFEDDIELDINYNRQIEVSLDTSSLIREIKREFDDFVVDEEESH